MRKADLIVMTNSRPKVILVIILYSDLFWGHIFSIDSNALPVLTICRKCRFGIPCLFNPVLPFKGRIWHEKISVGKKSEFLYNLSCVYSDKGPFKHCLKYKAVKDNCTSVRSPKAFAGYRLRSTGHFRLLQVKSGAHCLLYFPAKFSVHPVHLQVSKVSKGLSVVQWS
jgi:hypothetical protein